MKIELTILALFMSLGVMAIPRPSCYTDGCRVYEVRNLNWDSSHGGRLSFESNDSVPFMMYMQESAQGFVLDSLDCSAPQPCNFQAGDTMRWYRDGADQMVFFHENGRAYLSLKPCPAPDVTLEQMRRCDSLMLIVGTWEMNNGSTLRFSLTSQGEPCLTIGENGTEETVSFQPDVIAKGKALMHLKTPRRRWLLKLSENGMNIYQAVWSKKYNKYTRGRLLFSARGTVRLRMWEQYGMPFVDILDRYCTRSMYQRMAASLEPVSGQGPLKCYYELLKLLEEGKEE